MWVSLKYRELAAVILLLVPVVLDVRPALAQPASTNQLQIWLGQATLTGDWGGLRNRLKNAGVDLNAEFLTESAANPIRGRLQAARYTQEIDFGADLDLDR